MHQCYQVVLESEHLASKEARLKPSNAKEQEQLLSLVEKDPSTADPFQPLCLSHYTDQITYTRSLHTQEELELLRNMLQRNKDIFPWTHMDMPVIYPIVESHKLNISPNSLLVR